MLMRPWAFTTPIRSAIDSMVPVLQVGEDHIIARTRLPRASSARMRSSNRFTQVAAVWWLPTGVSMRGTSMP
ncbi:hypothetical protein SAMN04489708_101291 [Paracidovorax cattleyae]|uniref:Uncharacterized protein n=1 Tax=Paracidovorax cattleyae TaxID=80868 RepID=A0A1H0KMR0_9BURK|nr:hypothetical protein SAMN04489708_101291 [Paracidovorax cattleyae]